MILDESIGRPDLLQEPDPRELAGGALAAWGLTGAGLTVLEQKKNFTFRVDDDPRPGSAGGRYLLRLCDPRGYSPEEIASEAAWLLALRQGTDVAAPEPVRTLAGPYVAPRAGGARHGILFRWIPGSSLDSSLSPEMLVQLGALLGRMHAFSRRFTPPPGFTRPRYDLARILGDPEVLPPGWNGPLLTRRDRDLLAAAARAVRIEIGSLDESPEIFGMIHTDPEPDNMVQRDGVIYPIDFADCGWGYWLYDLAATLLPLGERRDLTELRRSLLEGYLRAHALSPGYAGLLDTFLIVRVLFALRWMLVEGWWREAVRAYAATAVPRLLTEVRRYLDRGAAPTEGAPSLARLSTVRFLALLRDQGIQIAAEGDRLRVRATKGMLATFQEEIAARKPEILAALRHAKAAAALPTLVRGPQSPDREYPLSFSQRQLWFLDQLDPGNPSYNIPQAVQMAGSLNPDVLEASLREVVRRQAALRTIFAARPGDPVQIVLPPPAVRIPVIDLRGLPARKREEEIARRTRSEARRPFDLSRGPLLRFTLLRLADEEHRALVTTHHIASDGQSGGVLIRELVAIYEAYSERRPSPLPEPPVQYTDYAEWQRRWLDGERLSAKLEYWRRQLRDVPAVFDLPFDRPRPSHPTPWGGRLDVEIPAGTTRHLRALGQAENATLFMVLLAGFAALLERLSGRSDIVVGSPVANRSRAETEGLIGFFVNTVVLRLQVGPHAPFRALLAEARRVTQEAYSHQDLPFEKLVEELRPERSLSHTPLFQVLFNYQPALLPEMRLGGLLLRWISTQGGMEKFELNLGLRETREGVAVALSYKQDLFDPSTVARLAERYLALLDRAAAEPDRPVAELPLLSAAERQQLREWNDTAAGFAGEPCLDELILAQAARAPDALAVVAENGGVSYGELARQSGLLGARLREQGVGPETLVGLCVERSLEMVIGILAVLRAGGAYVPLDPGLPAVRLEYMLADSGAAVLLATETLAARCALPGPKVLRLDEATGRAGDETSFGPDDRPGAQALAYVIYTSGSTGQPKGAGNTHDGVRNRILWAQSRFALTPGDVVLQKTPFSFDVSVWELLWPLMVGARLVMARPGGHLDPAYLVDLVAREGITTLHFVPAMLGAFLEREDLGSCRALRRVLASGEALPAELARRFQERLEAARLYNLYGPTEASIDVSWWPCEPASSRTSVPIGRPTANVRLYALEASHRSVPLGTAGELHIGGVALARGYWRRPALTAERFVPDLVSGEPGARLYRTGDQVRFRPDGEIEYLGRLDQQVKLRGFRIELGEIEAVLRDHPGIRDAAVIVREDAPGSRLLVAYLVGDPPGRDELRAYLGAKLPEYMVPSRFVRLAELPLQPNGKLDRRALPAPERSQPPTGAEDLPGDPVAELLAGMWSQLLGLPRVGISEDFFLLGGHSLLATQVISRLRSLLGVELPLRTLFERRTVAGLAQAVRDARRKSGEPAPPIAPAPRTGSLPLSFAQQRLWLLDQLVPNDPAYNVPIAVRLDGELTLEGLEQAFAEIVRRHEVLRTRFSPGEGTGGEPVQSISPPRAPELPLVDLSGLPANRREARVRELAREEARRPFDLARGPLLRLVLWRVAKLEHLLGITLHHAVADGWSLDVMLRELSALYGAFVVGRPSPLPELPIQYADFAVWQRRWLAGDVLERQLAFWREQLAGAPPLLDLPTDRPRQAGMSSRGGTVSLVLPAALTAAAEEASARSAATLFMLLLAPFMVLFARHTGGEDLVVGTPIANRTRREFEGLIGFFVNTLLLRTDLSGRPTFGSLVAQVKETALAAYDHQDLPFERLLEELAPDRSSGQPPFLQVMFAVNAVGSRRAAGLELPGLAVTPLASRHVEAKFDLGFSASRTDAGLRLELVYKLDLFDSARMQRMLDHYTRLLATAIAAPETPWMELPMLGRGERHQLLYGWNDSGRAWDPGTADHLYGLVTPWVAATPDAVALISGERCLTYGELAARVDRLASRLLRTMQPEGDGPLGSELRVGILTGPSLERVIALLAVLRAGGAYLPLDPEYPAARTAQVLGEAAVPLLLTERALLDHLPPLPECTKALVLDAALDSLPAPLPPLLRPATGDLAYIIYTSGSTGVPNGVLVRHQAAANLIAATRERHRVLPPERVSHLVSFGFDAAVLEIFLALASGAGLVIAGREERVPGPSLLLLLQRKEVGHMVITPSVFSLLPEGALPALRTVSIGGESCPGELAARWAPRLALLHCYGPTETAIFSTASLCRGDSTADPPIGRPVENTETYVLDRRLDPVPLGAYGELCVGGSGLARGYLDRPGLTAERFVPHPWSASPGARLYRTGDRARHLPAGELAYAGRIDKQVKIRGFRIEPAEIEAALAGHPAVRECAVVPQPGPGGEARLIAWLATAAEPGPAERELLAYLRERLPAHMVPAAFGFLPELPLTANGKVDRRALAARKAPPGLSQDELQAPRDLLELRLVQLWEELLQGPVGVRDDFFARGGHSLLAVRLVAEVRSRFGREIPLAALFANPTVERLAALVRRGGEPVRRELLVPIRAGGTRPPLFLVHPVGGNVLCYATLARHLGPDQPVWGIQSPGSAELPAELRALAASYTDTLLRALPSGLYHLGGWSLGAVVAFEMARQLAAAGRPADRLLLLDPPCVRAATDAEPDLRELTALFARDLAGLAGQREGARAAREGDPLAELLAETRQAGILPAATGEAELRELFSLFRSNFMALRKFQPAPYAGRATLFRAAARPAERDPLPEWRDLVTDGLEVETIPGDHWALLREPEVATLAASLTSRLLERGA